jgi:hypothetical protein
MNSSIFCAFLVAAISTWNCQAVARAFETPTLTPTETSTPTSSFTPTPTPTHTPAPTPTQVGRPDISKAMVTLFDLPVAFDLVSRDSANESKQGFDRSGLVLDNLAVFYDDYHGQTIITLNSLLTSEDQLGQFNAEIRKPDLVLLSLGEYFGGENLKISGGLPGTQDVGDARSAVTMTGTIPDMHGLMRWDMIIFRRGPIGVLIINLYADSYKEAFHIQKLAPIVDERIVEVLKTLKPIIMGPSTLRADAGREAGFKDKPALKQSIKRKRDHQIGLLCGA